MKLLGSLSPSQSFESNELLYCIAMGSCGYDIDYQAFLSYNYALEYSHQIFLATVGAAYTISINHKLLRERHIHMLKCRAYILTK